MKISPNRILYLDEVRCLAIILVVLEHIVRIFCKDFSSWLICSGIFSLTRIGVPLFFTVSGALLLTRKQDVMQFLEKRFKRIVFPFVFWIIVYMILGVVLWGFALTPDYALGIILGSHGFASLFWFIWALLGAYLMIPILSSFIREYDGFAFKYLVIIIIGLSLLSTFGFFKIEQAKYEFRVIYNFFYFLAFFILGSYIHTTEFKMSNGKSFLFGVVLFIIGIAGHFIQIYYSGLGGTELKPVDFFNIFVLMETLGLFIAFKYADVKMISSKLKPLKEQKLGEVILSFSTCSFGIYFSHYIFMLGIFKWGFKGFWTDNLWNLPLSFIIITGFSWALIWAMSKIPLLKIGSGVK